ncbi:MAG: leucyl/phenylalanyl-tRNA--protein transferase [Opitutales bacterium]
MHSRPRTDFPDPRTAPRDGPIAIGGDLSVERLLAAYARGIFPWFGEDEPILWWCPDPRFVLLPEAAHIAKNLERERRKPRWRVTMDTAFQEVIHACASQKRHDQDGTWITPEMRQAYTELHRTGFAHSVECWCEGSLAGGLYGVSLGGVFFGESMFHHADNASKVAFAALLDWLRANDFDLIDCQQRTRHLASFGARETARDAFLDQLEASLQRPTLPGPWRFD